MSFREEMIPEAAAGQGQVELDSNAPRGIPAGARQNVRSDVGAGHPARPGGAAQNSGGAIEPNADRVGRSTRSD